MQFYFILDFHNMHYIIFDNISIDFCIKLSVYVSIFAVASSKTNISGLCAKILANANNCFSPAEYEFPLSFATSSIPFGKLFINSLAEDTFIKFYIISYTFSKNKWILKNNSYMTS